jgi:hypothetical protein
MKTYKFTKTFEDIFFYEITAETEEEARKQLVEMDRSEATGRSFYLISSDLQSVEDTYYADDDEFELSGVPA